MWWSADVSNLMLSKHHDEERGLMIDADDVNRIAKGWIEEYSIEPQIAKIERERSYFFELDDLIHRDLSSALLVLEAAARKHLIDWTHEGLAGGPIRTFLYLYPDEYRCDLDAICRRTPAFAMLHALAVEGM